MSRATVDLQSVRFFLGYGLIFIGQSLLSIVLAAIAMFLLQPGLAALALAPVPFVVLIAQRYGKRSRPAMQEAQQRIAELTAEAEENVSGVRVVKAFAQEQRQLARFRNSVQRVFDQQLLRDADPGALRPDDQLPAEPRPRADPARRRPGGHQGDAHPRPVHRLLRVSADADLPDADARLHAGRRATRYRVRRSHLPGARPRAANDGARDDAPALPDGPGHVALSGVSLTFEGSPRPALRDINLDLAPGQNVALVGAMGSGKTALVSLLPRLYDVSAGSVRIDGADVRSVDLVSLRHAIALVTDDPVPVLRQRPREHRLRTARGNSRRGGARRTGCTGGWVSSAICPMATTRSSASAGSRSPAGSVSGSRSRARSSPIPGS